MSFGGIFDYPAKERKLNEVNAALEDPKVWDNPKRAQELGKEKKSLEDVVHVLDRLSSELSDNTELFEMSKGEGDDAGMPTSACATRTARAAWSAPSARAIRPPSTAPTPPVMCSGATA